LEIHYHPGKANLVADALSRKEHVHSAVVAQLPDEIVEDFRRLNMWIVAHTEGVTIDVEPTLEQEIRKGHIGDAKVQEIRDLITEGRGLEFTEDEQGTVWFKDKICVPHIESLRETILKETHDSDYSIHPGSTKMYQDLERKYWWYGLKRHVDMGDVRQRVKAEHQRPVGLLHPLKIPEWKWEEIGMNFIIGLPRTPIGYDSIWVIVDRLTKVAHFIPVKTTYKWSQLAELYMARIVSLHGVAKKIILDRGSQFTPRFWKSFHENTDLKLNFSLAIVRLMDKLKGLIKHWKICWELVPLSMKEVGIKVYLMLSSHIIIVTRPVWRCHHLRLCMAGNAGLLYIGSDWRKAVLWTWTYSRGRITSLYNSRGFEGSSDQTKELCG
jgi:hypothetical protein